MAFLPLSFVLSVLCLTTLPLSVQSALSYSSWARTVFSNLPSSSSASPSTSTSSSSTTTTVNFNGALNGAGSSGTPFNSVSSVAVTVSSSANLAYPFTSTTYNGHTFSDVDTGIDVLAGGVITFRMPATGTGLWCYELGRSLAGSSACSGPAGYTFDVSPPQRTAHSG